MENNQRFIDSVIIRLNQLFVTRSYTVDFVQSAKTSPLMGQLS